MVAKLDEQINQLNQMVAEIESQRSIFGDKAVKALLEPVLKKAADFAVKVGSSPIELPDVSTRKRKQDPLLYSYMVELNTMTRQLDPEVNLERMENAMLLLDESIHDHGRSITKFTGDGVMAIFGDPVAREDVPEQVLRARLEILVVSREVVSETEKELDLEFFKVNIGIDSGLGSHSGLTQAEDNMKGQVVDLPARIV